MPSIELRSALRSVVARANRRPAIVALTFGGLATIFSVWGSWVPSLWGDEAASQLAARRTLPGLAHLVQHVDAVHGTYYLLLHLWVCVFGYAPFSIRFPSCLAVGACTGLVVWLCLRLTSPRVAVLAGIACAVLPRLTYAGAEARSFSFDAAFAAGLWVVAVEIVRRPRRSAWWWALYGAMLTAATYLFLYTALVTLAVGAFLLVSASTRRHWRGWILASICSAVAAAPVVVVAYLERAQISYLKTGNYASWDVIWKQMWFGDAAFAWVGWIFMGIAAAALACCALPLRRLPPRVAAGRAVGVVGVCWVVVPTAILLVANAFFPLFTARYAAITVPGAAILIAVGVDAAAGAAGTLLRARTGGTMAAAVLVVIVVVVAFPNWAGQRRRYSENQSDWNQIAATVRTRSRPGDAIVFDGSARPSRRPRLAYDTAPPGAFGPVRDVLLKTPARSNYTWYAATYSVARAIDLGRFRGTQRVWVVEYRTPHGLSGSHRPDRFGLAALQRIGFRILRTRPLHASVVYLLTRRR